MGTQELLIISTILLYGAVFFLPSTIGWRKKNAVMIFVVNVSTAWTIIGWVVALVWAIRDEPKVRADIEAPQY